MGVFNVHCTAIHDDRDTYIRRNTDVGKADQKEIGGQTPSLSYDSGNDYILENHNYTM